MGEANSEEAGRGDVGEAAVGAGEEREMSSRGEARDLYPDEAARSLAISLPSLRRYAADYEGVFDELPRYEGRRVFSREALERLKAAQALLRSKQTPSLEEALLRVKDEPGLVTAAGTAEAEREVDAPGDADMAGATRETGSPSTADAPDEVDVPAQQVGPPLEARLEPGDAGADEALAGGLQVTLHLTKGGWRLVAEGGVGEGEKLLALLEPLVRAADPARRDKLKEGERVGETP